MRQIFSLSTSMSPAKKKEKKNKKEKRDSIKNEDRLGLDGKLFMHVGVSVGISLLLKTDFLC